MDLFLHGANNMKAMSTFFLIILSKMVKLDTREWLVRFVSGEDDDHRLQLCRYGWQIEEVAVKDQEALFVATGDWRQRFDMDRNQWDDLRRPVAREMYAVTGEHPRLAPGERPYSTAQFVHVSDVTPATA